MTTVSQRNKIAHLFIIYILKLGNRIAKGFTKNQKNSISRVGNEMTKIKRTDTAIFWDMIQKKFPILRGDKFASQKRGGVWGIINFLGQIEKDSVEAGFESSSISKLLSGGSILASR